MPDIQELLKTARDCGFENSGELRMAALEFLPEVREMCAADRCHSYGKNWVCPPACGSLEEIAERAAAFSRGILVQTTKPLENSFDYESMVQAERTHSKRFLELIKSLREHTPELLPMGAGGCRICESCTYPDAPCRSPELAFPSMEAYGLLVSRVCQKSELPYYYGSGTMTYTSCVLFK